MTPLPDELEKVQARKKPPTPRVSPATPPPPPRELQSLLAEDEDESFFRRHGLKLAIGVLLAAGAGWLATHRPESAPVAPRKQTENVIRIQLPPPPPPPPPPPKIKPPEPPKDQKRLEETPVAKPEPKPEAPKPKADEKPPEGLGTGIKGNGPGMAGLGSSGNGVIGGTGTGPGGGGGTGPGRRYVGALLGQITEAARTNPKTRIAQFRVDARVWLDGSGRVTRAELVSSTGDAALDATLKDDILLRTRLPDPPPGLRMPIPLRFSATRPR